MLEISEIHEDDMIGYINNSITDLWDFESNITEYYMDNLSIIKIDNGIISVVVNYKSKEPTIHEDFKINGQIVSMDYVMVKNVDIPIKDYIFFLRGKKLSQITNGIL